MFNKFIHTLVLGLVAVMFSACGGDNGSNTDTPVKPPYAGGSGSSGGGSYGTGGGGGGGSGGGAAACATTDEIYTISTEQEWTDAITAIHAVNAADPALKRQCLLLKSKLSLSSTTSLSANGIDVILIGTETLERTGATGALLNLADGSFTLNGPTLADNATSSNLSPLVQVTAPSSFTLKKGKITDGASGGVAVRSGTFTMEGGEIKNNKNVLSGNGGGVEIGNGATFTLSGGSIVNNSAKQGGGVFVGTGGTFTMSGGTINKNTATDYGAGVYVSQSATFTKTKGKIYGDTNATFVESADENTVTSAMQRGHAVAAYYLDGVSPTSAFKYRDKTAWDSDEVSLTTGTLSPSNFFE